MGTSVENDFKVKMVDFANDKHLLVFVGAARRRVNVQLYRTSVDVDLPFNISVNSVVVVVVDIFVAVVTGDAAGKVRKMHKHLLVR